LTRNKAEVEEDRVSFYLALILEKMVRLKRVRQRIEIIFPPEYFSQDKANQPDAKAAQHVMDDPQ
jgi:predicted RNA polymerase sigma factor